MTQQIGTWRVQYRPGDWIVLSGPTSLVVLQPASLESSELVTALWEQVVASATITDLAARIASYGVDTMPSFAALFWHADGLRSLVRGEVALTDRATGATVAQGEDVQTWSEVGLSGVEHLEIELPSEGVAATEFLALPLVVGAVRASSVVLDSRSAALLGSPQEMDTVTHAVAEPDADESEPDEPDLEDQPDTEPFDVAQALEVEADETVRAAASRADRGAGVHAGPGAAAAAGEDAGAGAQQASGADEDENADTELMYLFAANEPGDADSAELVEPESEAEPESWPADPELVPGSVEGTAGRSLVMAVTCPRLHPNSPLAAACRVCGEAISPQGPRLVNRPVLARLRDLAGDTVDLDRPVRIGRAPSPDDAVPGHLMTVVSPSQDISRTHLEIAPDEWRVIATDLHSTNGTLLVSADGAIGPHPLIAGEAVVLELGAVLELGDGVTIVIDPPPGP